MSVSALTPSGLMRLSLLFTTLVISDTTCEDSASFQRGSHNLSVTITYLGFEFLALLQPGVVHELDVGDDGLALLRRQHDGGHVRLLALRRPTRQRIAAVRALRVAALVLVALEGERCCWTNPLVQDTG